MGVSRYLKEQSPAVQIIGPQPTEGSQFPGIRRWPEAYLPKIFERERVGRILDVSQQEATAIIRRLDREEGGRYGAAAIRLVSELDKGVVVCIICDR